MSVANNTTLHGATLQNERLTELRLLLTLTPQSVLIFGIYRAESDIDAVREHLAQNTDLTLQTHHITSEQTQPLLFLRDLPAAPRQVIFSVYQGNLTDDLTTLAQNINVQRELLNQVDHALVMWFREESFARFIRQAPDFWAWHSATFDFQSPVPAQISEAMVEIDQLPRPDFKNRPHLEHRAQTYRDVLAVYTDPKEQDIPYIIRTRLRLVDTLYDLTRYEEAFSVLNIAKQQAKQHKFGNFFADLKIWEGNLASALGQREAALEATQEAVDLFRKLAATHPDIFSPDLANALRNLGNRFDALSQHKFALEATQEAVDLFRKLAATRPDTFNPELASSLSNLGVSLEALKHYEESLEVTQEAVDLLRKLAATRPDTFNPELARSLNNLGNRFETFGKYEAALEAMQEAVDLFRKLAATRSDVFNRTLAASLNNLSHIFNGLGRHEAALEVIQEAVNLFRKLASVRPDVFNPSLAMSLNNLGNRLDTSGQRELALKVYYEAVKTLCQNFLDVPQIFAEQMAHIVQNYRQQCEIVGEEPDGELLEPIERLLASLSK